ncbi:MAG: glycosyltransferase family 39 protein [Bacteroidota bacterium]
MSAATFWQKYSYWIIGLGAACLFLPYLGAAHLFDWDEINFAEAAREMIVSGEYSRVQINYQSFQEKPPLFFWLQVLSMQVFGVNEWAARFPNAICGIISLLCLFRIGSRWVNDQFAWWWVGLYTASLLPHFYFKSGIIDPWFNLFIFLGIAFLVEAHLTRAGKVRRMAYSGLLIGVAIMTKGPVALLIYGLVYTVFIIRNRFRNFLSWRQILAFSLSMLAVGGTWFLVEILRGRAEVVQEFIVYQIRLLQTQDAGHGGPFFYHFPVLLLGCFPASLFFLYGYRKNLNAQPAAMLWMKILFWVVLLLFSLVRTKIVHYSSLCYFPLTFVAAWGIYQLKTTEDLIPSWLRWSLGFIGTLLAIIFTALPLVDRFKTDILGSNLIKDPFAAANLQADVYWGGWEWLLGLAFGAGLIMSIAFINRKGWAYYSLLGICILGLEFLTIVYIPKVEQYTQAAPIAFYESKQGEDCYLHTVGFKSYAHLFYGRKPLPSHPRHADEQWLLSGEADKPVYVVTKNIRKKDWLSWHPLLEVMYEENGFVFMRVREKE